jgi:hypothetical protein
MGQCHAQSMTRVYAADSELLQEPLQPEPRPQPEGGPWCCAVSGCADTTNTVTNSEASDFKLPASRLQATGAPTSWPQAEIFQHRDGLEGDQAGNLNVNSASAQPPEASDSEPACARESLKHLEYGFDFALTQEQAEDVRVHWYFSTKWM